MIDGSVDDLVRAARRIGWSAEQVVESVRAAMRAPGRGPADDDTDNRRGCDAATLDGTGDVAAANTGAHDHRREASTAAGRVNSPGAVRRTQHTTRMGMSDA
jgi:hypothetical protein